MNWDRFKENPEEFMFAMVHTKVRNQREDNMRMPQAGLPDNVYDWNIYSEMHQDLSNPEFSSYPLPLRQAFEGDIHK